MEKYERYSIEFEKLVSVGWKPETIFYQIGGGEDEDYDQILVKNSKALLWDYTINKWRMCDYNKIKYIDGFDYDYSVIVDISRIINDSTGSI